MADKTGEDSQKSRAAASASAVMPKKQGIIQVPCCQCIAGKGTVIPFITGPGGGAVPWQVSGPGVSNPVAQTITSGAHANWNANLAPASWVQPDGSNGATLHPAGTFSYRISINVPNCVIPMNVLLVGQAAGDDEVWVYRAGNLIGQTPHVADPSLGVAAASGGYGFRAARIVSFSDILAPGIHTLRFDVSNGPNSPHGLLVRGEIRTTCHKVLEW
jgi:hypothetical protein